MRKFKFAKLVRDKIPADMIKKKTQKPVVRILDDDEYILELKKKVLEEAGELTKASDNELLEEVADMEELLDNFLRVLKTNRKNLRLLQKKKNKERGSFKKKLYIDTVEVEESCEWLGYYLKSPDKYPEIK